MTRNFGAGVCYDNVARFINGESIKVVTETEKVIRRQSQHMEEELRRAEFLGQVSRRELILS